MEITKAGRGCTRPRDHCGNVLGISSTALMMGLYKRMNVNLAMVLGTCGSNVLVQLAFWRLVRPWPLWADRCR